jgi:hypothetical protein
MYIIQRLISSRISVHKFASKIPVLQISENIQHFKWSSLDFSWKMPITSPSAINVSDLIDMSRLLSFHQSRKQVQMVPSLTIYQRMKKKLNSRFRN